MKKLIKINSALLFALALSLGFMSFKATNTLKSEWYSITPGASETADVVENELASPSEDDPNCETEDNDQRCALFLENLPDSYNPNGKTIQQVMTDLNISAIDDLVSETAFRDTVHIRIYTLKTVLYVY